LDKFRYVKLVGLPILHLLVIEWAWTIKQTSTQETRTYVSTVKFTMIQFLREISLDALRILRSLGTTDLTPLQHMHGGAPAMGLTDVAHKSSNPAVERQELQDCRPLPGVALVLASFSTRKMRSGSKWNRQSTSALSPLEPPGTGKPTSRSVAADVA
jgi:hypothetical protein